MLSPSQLSHIIANSKRDESELIRFQCNAEWVYLHKVETEWRRNQNQMH